MGRKFFNSSKAKRILMMLFMVICVISVQFSAFAEAGVDYYETFADWQEAEKPEKMTWNDVVDEMDKVIEAGKQAYAEGDMKAAYDRINNAYYGWYETTGFERIAMGYISGSRKTEMELQFAAVKAVTKDSAGTQDQYDTEATTLSAMLREDANILDGNTSSDESSEESSDSTESSTQSTGTQRSAEAAAFIACFTIILREGFEAILIVGAIIAYLLKTAKDEKDGKRKTRPVYMGAVIGIIMSFVTAWLLNQIKLANSASQEVIEGITALIAVCVLYYVSNWMLSKSESEAWSSYIQSKVAAGSEKNSMFALAFTAFLSVYREGAEVVLFYQPMLSGNYDKGAVWGGFVMGCIVLVFVFIAIRVFSLKIPLKPFFTGTSILMFIMAIAFLGSGIKELIEGDVFTLWAPAWVSWIPSHPVLEILGIYPCGQTVIAQLILLAITVIIIMRQVKKNQDLRAKMIAEHPEILEEEKNSKKATRGDVVELVNSLAEKQVSKEEIIQIVESAVEKALKTK